MCRTILTKFKPNRSCIQQLKMKFKNYELGEIDWYEAYLNAINSVSGDICVKEHRRCDFPLSNDLLASEEEEKNKNESLLLLSCLCTNAIIMRNSS